MSVGNGQPATATTFNSGFLSRTVDSDTVGIVGLKHAASGGLITNAQQQINTNESDISDNTSDIAVNTANVLTNTGNISTNTTNISTNQSNITTLQATAPTADEKAALAGTDGAPAVGNKYVTDSDPRLGGGGGGAGALWFNDTDAPIEEYEQGIQKHFFSEQEIGNQKLYFTLNVPSGYTAGNQISVYLKVHTAATSNDYNMQVVTTLIRDGVDAITSTTNQNTADSGDITASTANLYKKLTITLTDGSGEINSVAVGPDDLLILELTRKAVAGTDITEDVKFVPSTSDFVFV